MFGNKKKRDNIEHEMNFKMHNSVTVGSKGQVVIPKEVRDMLNIQEGENLLTITKYDKFVGFIKTDEAEDFIELIKTECHID